MSTRTQNRVSGFTLVELLVVIGIIALLISILLPSLNKARKAAASVQCASNMRQAGMYLQMYADDFKGWLAPQVELKSASTGNQVNWMTYISEVYQKNTYTAQWDTRRPPGMWACPQSQKVMVMMHGATTDYGRNVNTGMKATIPLGEAYCPIKMSQVRRPSAKWTAIDSKWIDGTSSSSYPTMPTATMCARDASPWSAPAPVGNIDFRHPGDTANVLYLDWHVGSLTRKEMVAEYSLPNTNPSYLYSWKPTAP